MSNTFGRHVRYSIFGESHGAGLGILVDNLPPGIQLDLNQIQQQLDRRKPGQNELSTSRQEPDQFEILSGYHNGHTTGTPLCAMICNTDQRSADYGEMALAFRPSHADYTGYVKYKGFNDIRGGGHFSGRITAALVFAGAVARQLLELKGVRIVSHILKSGDVEDLSFERYSSLSGDRQLSEAQSAISKNKSDTVPMLEEKGAALLIEQIQRVKKNGDSIGGIVETAILGLKAGVGNPYFESLESELSKILFSVPGVKGVSFGAGFDFAGLYGSTANDALIGCEGEITTSTNRSGGINGGISNGMPVVFQTVFRPTPSIALEQQTVNRIGEAQILGVKGRHDPCIFLRGLPVVEAVAAMVMLDQLRQDFI